MFWMVAYQQSIFPRELAQKLLPLLIVVVCLIASLSANIPHHALAASHVHGLVASFSFDEGNGTTVTDTSVHGHQGQISGATWEPQGRFGAALSFNGANNYVVVPDGSSLDITGELTLEAWIYPHTLGGYRAIINKTTSGEPNSYYLGTLEREITFGLYTGDWSEHITRGVNLSPDTWYHVTAVYNDAFDNVRIYVNGIEVLSAVETNALVTNDEPLRIGLGYPGEAFHGYIDEIRIYNRALTPDELQVDIHTPVGPATSVVPRASFRAFPTRGRSPLTVNFTDTSTGGVSSWWWDFGDGTTSTVQHPTHTYMAAGSYTVSLIVTGEGDSNSNTQSNDIIVSPSPPIASFRTSLITGPAPLTVVFTDTSMGDVTSWWWDFGDGTTSTVQHPTHTYMAAGTYTVSLTVTGAGGIGQVALTWSDIKNSHAEVGGYRLYHGRSSGVYESSLNVGDRTTYTVTDLTVGQTYYFAVTAYDRNGGRESGFSNETSAIAHPPSDTVVQTNAIVVIQARFALEAGEVMADHRWQQVTFNVRFLTPVVVAAALSENDADPAVVRIRNVTSKGFEIQVQEWDYLDGMHALERIGYLVIEQGNYTLPDGTRIEAGSFKTDKTTGSTRVLFGKAFQVAPVVHTAVTRSVDRSAAIAGRVHNVRLDSFYYRMQTQRRNPLNHSEEIITYIAWEPSEGTLDGVRFKVGRTPDVVQDAFFPLPYVFALREVPVFLAEMQTFNGGDPANIRWRHKTQAGVDVRVAEEESLRKGFRYRPESVGYMLFSTDVDGDGLLSRDEMALYGTNPSLADTDDDGIRDGDEVAYWGAAWALDYDNDGFINLLDPDSDGDGYLDGLELYYGSDPGDPRSIPLLSDLLLVGEVVVDHTWQAVSFRVPFLDPVVIVGAFGHKDKEPGVIQLRNVTSRGFDIRVQEWDYLDGVHVQETVGYLVMERGSHRLSDGTQVEAGGFTIDRTAGFETILFKQSFKTVPVVFTAVTPKEAGTKAVTGRVQNIDIKSFQYRLQEQQRNTPTTAQETVSYLAWEPSMGTVDEIQFEVDRTREVVQNQFQSILYLSKFSTVPVFLAEMQTFNGAEPSNVRWRNKKRTEVEVRVSEEQSLGNGTWHRPEVVGYIIIR
jgi:PKD repeat protein